MEIPLNRISRLGLSAPFSFQYICLCCISARILYGLNKIEIGEFFRMQLQTLLAHSHLRTSCVCGGRIYLYWNIAINERELLESQAACLGCACPDSSVFYFELNPKEFSSCLASFCGLAPEVGDCRALLDRWYFDVKAKKCKLFQYGGCGGNPNNFDTLKSCEKSCGSFSGRKNLFLSR